MLIDPQSSEVLRPTDFRLRINITDYTAHQKKGELSVGHPNSHPRTGKRGIDYHRFKHHWACEHLLAYSKQADSEPPLKEGKRDLSLRLVWLARGMLNVHWGSWAILATS